MVFPSPKTMLLASCLPELNGQLDINKYILPLPKAIWNRQIP